ncbi:hypothetical protein Tco_1570114 [Tanacetum coccineum]
MLVYIDQSIAKDVKVIKELKIVFYDLTKVCNEMGAFIVELETLKCSSDVIRSDLFLNDFNGVIWRRVLTLCISSPIVIVIVVMVAVVGPWSGPNWYNSIQLRMQTP